MGGFLLFLRKIGNGLCVKRICICFFLIFQRRFSEFLFKQDDKMRTIRKSGAHTRFGYGITV